MRCVLFLICSVLIPSMAKSAGSDSFCSEWPSRNYFENASAKDVRKCLGEGASIASRDDDGRTPLHWAAAVSDDVAVLAELLAAGADLSLVDLDGYRAIHVAAAEATNPTVISYLVALGSDAEAEVSGRRGRCPWSVRRCADVPLHLAAARADAVHYVAPLLAAGVNVDARNQEGQTALHLAVKNATDEVTVNLLVSAGASVDIVDLEGRAPLHLATRQCDTAMKIIPSLLSAGASPDQRGKEGASPLMWGARFACHSGIVMLLMQASDSPCMSDDRERTVLDQWAINDQLVRDDVYWALHDWCVN